MNNAATTSLVPYSYWRASLAEVSLCHPEVDAENKEITIAQEGDHWIVDVVFPTKDDWVEKQFSSSKASSSADGKPVKTIPFVLIAARLSASASHGVKANVTGISSGYSLLCIPCLLDRQGKLLPDLDRFPWIPRDLLAPSLHEVTIGDLESYDRFLSTIPNKPTSFDESMRVAADMFKAVTQTTLPFVEPYLDEKEATPTFEREGYSVLGTLHGVPYNPPIIARHLIKLYDRLMKDDPDTPLLNRLRNVSDHHVRTPISIQSAEVLSKQSVGHVDREYALSPSQHEAMIELAALKNGQVLAVNGPPGTGKTTLLQSVVAQLWVNAALEKRECPIIVATSTNVKAVENVLDSFGKIGEKIGHERWIPYAGGFGLFMASNSRQTVFPVCTSDTHPFVQLEKMESVDSARQYYLDRASQYLGMEKKSVENVVDDLHQKLVKFHEDLQRIITMRYAIFNSTGKLIEEGAKASCDRQISQYRSDVDCEKAQIENAKKIVRQCNEQEELVVSEYETFRLQIDSAERDWSNYLVGTPLWLDIFSFIPFVLRRRNARDRVFLLSNILTANMNHRLDDVHGLFTSLRKKNLLQKQNKLGELNLLRSQAEEQEKNATKKMTLALSSLAQVNKLLNRWLELLGSRFLDLLDTSLEKLNDYLDVKIRAPMFGIADWYWSGMWLIEMAERLKSQVDDSRGCKKLELKYRRFSKLAPCFVSNFHMAPSFFTAWQGEDVPMWNVIDLLIVDEAGQVSPDIGAGMFAFAKRAIVVGDTFQIEPVWNIGETTDRSNAVKFGLISRPDDIRYETLAMNGYTPASGNLMTMAGRACDVRKFEDIRGLFLTEHRRCVPELIAYCNALVYAKRLLPMRPSLAAEDRLFPVFDIIDVQGQDKKIGSSRQNHLEAQSIVDWLQKHRHEIENHYRDRETGKSQPIWKTVGIITPFATQANLIERLIRKSIPDLMQKEKKLTVGTVHALQGAEREIVLFSPTYGEGYSGGMFFDRSPNMLNVAVSRAKDSFLIIGSRSIFDQNNESKPSGLLAKYLVSH